MSTNRQNKTAFVKFLKKNFPKLESFKLFKNKLDGQIGYTFQFHLSGSMSSALKELEKQVKSYIEEHHPELEFVDVQSTTVAMGYASKPARVVRVHLQQKVETVF